MTTTVVQTGIVANINAFNINDDWDIFVERLEQYFVANGVEEERKVPVLLTTVSEAVYKVLRNLCDPVLPSAKSFNDLKRMLTEQFKPAVSVYRKRIVFDSLKQSQESVREWYVKVKTLAADCEFGSSLEARVKDKFVTGMRPGRILDRLCEEKLSTPLSSLLEIAQSKEVLLQEAHQIEVNKVQFKKLQTTTSKGTKLYQKEEVPKCFHCGKGNHDFKKCKFKDLKCNKCNKKGHIAKVCVTKSKVSVNAVDNDSLNQYIDMYSVDVSYVNPLLIDVKLGGKCVKMELDTGAGVTCIPLSFYKKNLRKFKMENTDLKLKSYGGQIIIPVGQISISMEINKISKIVNVIIVKESEKLLLGRNILNDFGLNIVVGSTNVNSVSIKEEKLELNSLLLKYSDLFKDELGTYNVEKIHLDVENNVKPVFHKPRPIPFAFKEKVKLELDILEKKGVITKVDNSLWGTPLVPVMKPNGKDIRICANYKITVNKYLKDDNHPLPRIEELFAALQGGQSFSKLDLSNAYNQLVLDEETKKLLAWSTPYGIYAVNRLPFGTKPACSIFQRVIEKTLQGVGGTVNLLDDILVTGKDKQEHLKNLEAVLNRLQNAGFRVNLKKCEFFKDNIKYLGHTISKNGLKKDDAKVKAILEFPRPCNATDVKIFCGMVNYYSRFIPDLSPKMKPLYDLLQKGVDFKWSTQCQQAFCYAKKELASDRVLIHFDRSKQLRLSCDASQNGIGAVLSHVLDDKSERPICFISRVFSTAEKNYSMIHKEALAIYWACQKLYQYLIGTKFELVSDHKPLLALFGENRSLPPMVAGRLQRWSLFLSGFNYKFRHIKGELNIQADALSRYPIEDDQLLETTNYDYVHFIEENIPIDLFKIRSETRRDPILGKLFNYITYGFPQKITDDEIKKYFSRKDELNIDQGVIMWGYRVVIPTKYRKQLLKELHSTHEGMVKMKSNARAYFWWPGLDSEIEDFVKECYICSEAKPEPKKCKIISGNQASYPFERIHADFLGPIKGKMILIIVDSYSKWVEGFIMNNTDSKACIEKFREYFARFGLPKVVETDNGRQFESREFINFLQINGIKFLTSPPFHPATNGLAENAVKNFKSSLSKLLKTPSNSNASFETLMNRYFLQYRNSVHITTGVTPASLVFRNKIRTRLDLLKEGNKSGSMVKGIREEIFKEGDKVLCRDYRNPNKKGWVHCIIDEVLGDRVYMCKLINEDLIWKRHLDQIIADKSKKEVTENVTDNHDFDNFKLDNCKEYNIVKCPASSVVDEGLAPDESTKEPDQEGSTTLADSQPVRDCDGPIINGSPVKLNIHERPKRTIKPVVRLNL